MNRRAFFCRLTCVLFATLIGLGFAHAQVASTQPAEVPVAKLRVGIPGNVFATLEKNEPSGIFIEAVTALFKQRGVALSYLSMPTGVALKEVRKGTLSMATVVVPTASLRDSVFLSEPVITEYNVVMTLRDKGFDLSSLADLKGKNIGARAGYHYPLLENDSTLKITRYQSDGEMIRALLLGQSDVAIIAGVSDIYAFRAEGIMSRLEILKTAVGTVPFAVAFSKKSFRAEDVARFNEDLAAFKQSAEWQAILDRNGLADLVRTWPLLSN